MYRYVPHTVRHDPEGGMTYEIRCEAPGCAAESGRRDAYEAPRTGTCGTRDAQGTPSFTVS
ncbi:hypothetical protein [Streptomyces ferrugineus]